MDSLEALLASRSYEDVRVEDLMAAAGLTRTAFYRYFPDLDSVLLAWIEILGAEFGEAAERFLAFDVDPDEGLLAATTGLAEVWVRHRGLLRGIFDAATTGNRVQLAWRDLVESFLGPVARRLHDLAERGRTSIPNEEETARALVWMNERYYFETLARDVGVSAETAASTLADIWRRVIFTQPNVTR
jgi:TetR/AcrR family transcriptional regulator, ethionamide resistance regulator